ncbi:MAG: flagellar FlbD family protein [Marmoricola sp.]
MITLTRLSGSVFALNSDLIERVDSTPDTVITLVDGTKYVVRESLEEIVDAVRTYRGQIVALGARLADEPEPVPPPGDPRPRLAAVSSEGQH